MMLSSFVIAALLAAWSACAVVIDLQPRQSNGFSSCLAASQVTTLVSSSPGYANASLAFNRRLSYKPAAIVYPATTVDVSNVVKCAAASGISVVARSGGHSYAAYGLGGKNGSLVIDLSKMKSLTVDSKTGKAVSQTGNLLGDLAQGLWDNGKRALPHGTCPYVGTGGHASYGGFGLFSREAGLLLDRITAAEVVIANGTVLTVSNTTHPDLFWALRGAAPSFGIVTAWTFATLAAPKTLINYTLAWSKKISRSQAIQILNAYQTFAASKPRNELSMLCPLGVDDGAIDLTFTGTYYGSLTDFKAAIKPFQSKLPGSPKLTTKTFNWYDGLVDVTGPLSTKKPEPYDTFFAKSVVISKPLASSAVENWVDYMLQKGGDTGLWWWVEIDMYGGAVAQVPENTTAYAHRNNILNFQFYGGTPNGKGKFPSSGISFINGLASSLAPKPSGAYPNYIDPTLTADQWHTLYFAGNYGRLTKIKKAWDPRNVFSFPQSIPLAK